MRGLKIFVFGIIIVSVDGRIVNPFVLLSCNLSEFISQFERLHIRPLYNFFGQEDSPPGPNVPVHLWRADFFKIL